ncbi:hypothetical protein Aperf_G00000056293 [Anoplocephala perfoliata]
MIPSSPSSSSSSRSQRHRRFGTVQPPDFSRLGGGVPDRLRDLLNIDNIDCEVETGGGGACSSLPQIFPPPLTSSAASSTNVPPPQNTATTTTTTAATASTLLRGRSPTVKKTVSSEVALPPLSNSQGGKLTRSQGSTPFVMRPICCVSLTIVTICISSDVSMTVKQVKDFQVDNEYRRDYR